jgi:hypothetical protein
VIVSYLSGVQILTEHLAAIRSGEIRVLMFFLGSQYDHGFLREVREIHSDIDALTGSCCLAIAFMPPPPAQQLARFSFVDEGLRRDDPQALERYVAAMTTNTYALADHFDLPLNDLPAIAFVSTDAPDDYAILPLRGRTMREVYPSIRAIFSEWYQSNKHAIDARILQRLDPDERTVPRDVRAAIETAIGEQVVPLVAAAFEELLLQHPQMPAARVRRMLARLRRHPKDVKALADVLRHEKVKLPLNGESFDPGQFEREFDRMCGRIGAEIIASAAHASGPAALTPFPLSRVIAADRFAQMHSLATSASGTMGKARDAAGVVGSILKLFGL